MAAGRPDDAPEDIDELRAGRRTWALIAGLIVAAAASLVASVAFGAVHVPIGTVWSVIAQHLLGGPPAAPIDDQIVWDLRVPRALLALVVGGGLAVAGATLQALVRNALADPYVLGVESGASLGAVLVIGFGAGLLARLGVAGAAFAGALVAALAVILLARRDGSLAPTRLVLAGVAIGHLCSAGTSLVQFLIDPRQLQGVLFWLLGSVAGATFTDLGLPAVAVLAGTAWLVVQGRRLNVLSLGDESAAALGIDVERFRLELLVVSALLVGVLVAVAGGIGFVGLMVPHVVRMLVGPDHRRVLPVSMLLGAVFLVWVDVLARAVAAPSELPIGIFTAAVGAPFFLWLMRRSRTGQGEA